MHMKSTKKISDKGLEELPLITVITLSYRSKHLYDAVRSVLSQNYPSIQYIISDDATEDFDKDCLLRFIEQKNKGNICQALVLHHKTNIGTVANYNRALHEAKGKYIFPLAADDLYVNENVLYRWTQAFAEANAPVMCAYCDNYDEAMQNFLGRWPRPDHARILAKGNTEAIYRVMERVKILPGATMARTSDSLQTLGYFDETYRLLEDYPFAMQTLRRGAPIAFWPYSAVIRRGGGVSDGKKPHPQLVKDMEVFYEREVYTFSTDPNRLREYLENRKRKNMTILNFQKKWASSGLCGRLALSLRFPSCFARRVYHRMFRI